MAKIDPKAKQELMKAYDDQAADAYARMITHSPWRRMEDARERLIALNRTVPEPTKEELADSKAEEQSRTDVTFKVAPFCWSSAAQFGERCPGREPTLVDPPQVTAPKFISATPTC